MTKLLCCPSKDKPRGCIASGFVSRPEPAQGPYLAQAPRQAHGRSQIQCIAESTSPRGATRDSSPFPGGAREGCVADIHWLAKVPGEDASRGGTVQPRRVAEGAALARGCHDAWRKLPVSSTAPDRAFNEACGWYCDISAACQIYRWPQASHRCKGEEEWLPDGPHSRRFSGQTDRTNQRLITSARSAMRVLFP